MTIPEVIKSKRFIAAVLGVVAMLLVAAIPEFASAEDELISSLTAIILSLIAGYTFSDSLKAWLQQPGNIAKFGAMVAYGLDKVEAAARVDIPDAIEGGLVQGSEELAEKFANS